MLHVNTQVDLKKKKNIDLPCFLNSMTILMKAALLMS